MREVKVLGPGCKRCVTTAAMVQAEADLLVDRGWSPGLRRSAGAERA